MQRLPHLSVSLTKVCRHPSSLSWSTSSKLTPLAAMWSLLRVPLLPRCKGILLASLLGTRVAGADTAEAPPAEDRFTYEARSETYLRLFQRALLPGPGGALVHEEQLAPLHQYVMVRATDLDTSWDEDSVDVELAGWGRGALADVEPGFGVVDGDVTVANLRYRRGPMQVRAGRQVVSGGAARFAYMDGVSARVRDLGGFGFHGYAGFTVLPRWAQRRGYQHLGSAADGLLREPEVLPEPTRGGNWLAGARAFYDHRLVSGGLSFHEVREDAALGRRSAAADLRAQPHELLDVTALALLDLDSGRFADARLALDAYPVKYLTLSAEALHTEPALFLSRQSVLSVFSTEGFDELGGEATLRPAQWIVLRAAGYAVFFDEGSRGGRTRLQLRLLPDAAQRVVVQMVYSRAVEMQNGYHSGRSSVSYRILDPLALTAEIYGYWYDEPIQGVSVSTVQAANLEWLPHPELSLLAGGSVAQTPYAERDVQAVVRLVYAHWHPGGARP